MGTWLRWSLGWRPAALSAIRSTVRQEDFRKHPLAWSGNRGLHSEFRATIIPYERKRSPTSFLYWFSHTWKVIWGNFPTPGWVTLVPHNPQMYFSSFPMMGVYNISPVLWMTGLKKRCNLQLPAFKCALYVVGTDRSDFNPRVRKICGSSVFWRLFCYGCSRWFAFYSKQVIYTSPFPDLCHMGMLNE